MKRILGFSLAESLIALALLALLLGLAASIFIGYSRITRQATPHEQNLVVGNQCLERMRSEVSSSLALLGPLATGLTDSELNFEKIDPSVSSRLPKPAAITGAFEPLDPNNNCQVRYWVDNNQLKRSAVGTSWNHTEVLMDRVLGLQVQVQPPAGVSIVLNLQEDRVTRKLSAYGYLWGREWNGTAWVTP